MFLQFWNSITIENFLKPSLQSSPDALNIFLNKFCSEYLDS
jgi:hypothetical protein